MKIDPNNYADFVTIVKAVSGLDVVLFYDNSPTTFRVYAIFGGRQITCHVPGLSSKPGAFDTDFPDAVELTDDFGIGV